ncbi:MAG: hypothetical protein ABUS49_06905 [Acidobacteriota bacterium]
MADLVQFAYNMYTAGSPGQLMPPPDPGIDRAGYRLTFWLSARDLHDTVFYGYIAQSKTEPGDIVLAIRGTQSPAEWLLDFSALPVFFHADANVGLVALGFQSIEESFAFLDGTGVSSSLADAVARISAQSTIRSFTVLGHSLGAALATLAAAELAARNTVGVKPLLTLYTFASPRVGLLDFAAWCTANVANTYRIWNLLDIVPETPTFPYIHVAGLGDCLVQTTEQLAQLSKLPRCEHNLRSYQWLLDPANFSLDNGCSTAAPVAGVMTAEILAPGADTQTQGAISLARAMGGRG